MNEPGRLDNFVGELVRHMATIHNVAVQVTPGTHVSRLIERSYDLTANGSYVTVRLAADSSDGRRMISLRMRLTRGGSSLMPGDWYLMEQVVMPVGAVIAFALRKR